MKSESMKSAENLLSNIELGFPARKIARDYKLLHKYRSVNYL